MQTQRISFNETSQDTREKAIILLKKANLPTEDIDGQVKLFVLEIENEVIGTGGLELMDNYGLLRSISIVDAHKGKGYGKYITSSVEDYAKSAGVKELYLLTTTAKDFFSSKDNYEVIERNLVPESIKESQQFASICPSSAIIMKKIL